MNNQLEILNKNTNGYINLLSALTTARNTSTHYNTKEEQQAALVKSHKDVLSTEDKGAWDIYLLFLLLPGVLNASKRIGLTNVLSNESKFELLTSEQQKKAFSYLIKNLAPHMILKTIIKDHDKLSSIARVTYLSYFLGNKNLELWAVKYRKKLRKALTCLWHKKSIRKKLTILAKKPEERNPTEKSYINNSVLSYTNKEDWFKLSQIILFLFGKEKEMTTLLESSQEETTICVLPLIHSYLMVKHTGDITCGGGLPYETLLGLRNNYNPNIPVSEVMSLAFMSNKQRLNLQESAKRHDGEIEVDFHKQDIKDLYIYGLRPEFQEASKEEHKKLMQAIEYKLMLEAQKLSFLKNKKMSLVIDNSFSMIGSETSRYKPWATLMTFAGAISNCSKEVTEYYINEAYNGPSAHTDLAEAYIKALQDENELIIIISDGYENSPAGRLNEVINIAKKGGFYKETLHFNPVFSAETGDIRQLSPQLTPIPVDYPRNLVTGMLKLELQQNLELSKDMLLENLDKTL